MLVKLSQPPCIIWLISMLMFSHSQANLLWDIKHKIKLLNPSELIPYHRLRRISERELQEMQNHLYKYLKKGWIQPSTSRCNHTILFICKKTGELRIFIDYRSLYSNTIIDSHSIAFIDNTLDKLRYAKIFSKIDLTSGYHQVEMHPNHCHRTAF